MRAIYLENIIDESLELVDEKFHHLINVLRIKQNDELLLLNGKGEYRSAVIETILKKKVIIKATSEVKFKEKSPLKLAIGITKKDALDLSLKQACELGINKIYLVQTTYSQKLNQKDERFERVLVSALEQSNNTWLPEIVTLSSVEKLVEETKNNLLYFSSHGSKVDEEKKISLDLTLFIGPEGGLSQEEETFLINNKVQSLYFDNGIMRTPTAVSFGIGYLQGRIAQNN